MAIRSKEMVIWIIDVLVLLLVGSLVWHMWSTKNTIPKVSHGRLDRYQQFQSQFVPARDVAVWMPEDYQPGEDCDVLYMHDGQMLFDAATTWNNQEWAVDEVLDSLIKAGSIRRCIVVAINNTENRLNEYFPDKTWQYVNEANRMKTDTAKLQGDAYLQFIIRELKPFIDMRYKPLTSREHTFMMGSSMGGLISLYALCEYPQVFGGVACLSTHLSMAHLENGIDNMAWPLAYRNYVTEHLADANTSLIYMDHGTKDFDADYGPYQELLDSAMLDKGWDNMHYRSLVFQGEGHNETAWAKRLDQPLVFLLGR